MPTSLGMGLSTIWLAAADAGGLFSFGIELEDNSGIVAVETTGFIELETGP